MNTMKHSTTNTFFTEILGTISTGSVILAGILAAPVHASTEDTEAITKDNADAGTITRSISYYSSATPDITERDKLLRQKELVQYETSDTANASDVTLRNISSTASAAHYTSSEVTIYDASTLLISDINHDGFYHRFSVTFDADTIYTSAYIYAEIYLSYEGDPWSLYTISDNFHIHEDSEHDTYTVEAELVEGFPAGYYDVKIELYDADHDTWILSYGPWHDPSLAAIPLEDSYYDDYYEEIIVPVEAEVQVSVSGHGHGAMGAGMLLAPALLFMTRRLCRKQSTVIPIDRTTGDHE